jgi:hypothetical protein
LRSEPSWAPRAVPLRLSRRLGEQATPEFDQRPVLRRLHTLLGTVLAARLYADTLIIAGDDPQEPGLEQAPAAFSARV